MNKTRVALIGTGMVGTSFIEVAKSRGLADEYGLIDINREAAYGNVMDFEDAIPTTKKPYTIKLYEYSDLKNVNYIVVTAGRPTKPGESRLDTVSDNAKIMAEIAKNVKASGFNGIAIIASNPVDIMTTVFLKNSGLPVNHVIGSGTSLDTMRLRVELSQRLKVDIKEIDAFVLGEHGDSSFCNFSAAKISGRPISEFNLSDADKKEIQTKVFQKAYEIIQRKRATFYGIGSTLAYILHEVINDAQTIMSVDVFCPNEKIHIGQLAKIGKNGITPVTPSLDKKEKAAFDNSIEILKDYSHKI